MSRWVMLDIDWLLEFDQSATANCSICQRVQQRDFFPSTKVGDSFDRDRYRAYLAKNVTI